MLRGVFKYLAIIILVANNCGFLRINKKHWAEITTLAVIQWLVCTSLKIHLDCNLEVSKTFWVIPRVPKVANFKILGMWLTECYECCIVGPPSTGDLVPLSVDSSWLWAIYIQLLGWPCLAIGRLWKDVSGVKSKC